MSKMDDIAYQVNLCGSVIEVSRKQLYQMQKALLTPGGKLIIHALFPIMEADLVKLGMATDVHERLREQYVGSYHTLGGIREQLLSDIERWLENIEKGAKEHEVPK